MRGPEAACAAPGPSRNIDDHPPEPAPLRAYLPGGVPDGEGTGSVCDMCPWMTICEGPSDVTLDDGGLQHGPGEAEAIECTPFGSLRPRFEVAGTLLNMRRPRRSHEGPMLILSRDGHEVKVVTGTASPRDDTAGGVDRCNCSADRCHGLHLTTGRPDVAARCGIPHRGHR